MDVVSIVMTVKQTAYFCLGWICVALGAIGVVLPLLPTTPFILLAAYAFSKSSKRFHDWLLNHRVFGPLVRDWQQNGVIRLPAKILATVSIVLMLSLSFYFVALPLHVVSIICISVGCVMVFIWSRPSLPKQEN